MNSVIAPRRFERQPDHRVGSATNLTLDLDAAAVGFDHLSRKWKADACPFPRRLGREERSRENSARDGLRDACPVSETMTHETFAAPFEALSAESRPFHRGASRVDCVRDEVQDGGLHLLPTDVDPRGVVRQRGAFEYETDAALLGQRPCQPVKRPE